MQFLVYFYSHDYIACFGTKCVCVNLSCTVEKMWVVKNFAVLRQYIDVLFGSFGEQRCR